jgi:hypothetical protein
MRQKNLRLVVVGIALIVAALGFFLGMGTMAPKSNNPVALMQTVGQVAGIVGGIGIVMLAFGLIGRKIQV